MPVNRVQVETLSIGLKLLVAFWGYQSCADCDCLEAIAAQSGRNWETFGGACCLHLPARRMKTVMNQKDTAYSFESGNVL